ALVSGRPAADLGDTAHPAGVRPQVLRRLSAVDEIDCHALAHGADESRTPYLPGPVPAGPPRRCRGPAPAPAGTGPAGRPRARTVSAAGRTRLPRRRWITGGVTDHPVPGAAGARGVRGSGHRGAHTRRCGLPGPLDRTVPSTRVRPARNENGGPGGPLEPPRPPGQPVRAAGPAGPTSRLTRVGSRGCRYRSGARPRPRTAAPGCSPRC